MYIDENGIHDVPILESVPIVRCKNCKHKDAETGFCKGRGWPMQLVPDDGFCDKGERREDVGKSDTDDNR